VRDAEERSESRAAHRGGVCCGRVPRVGARPCGCWRAQQGLRADAAWPRRASRMRPLLARRPLVVLVLALHAAAPSTSPSSSREDPFGRHHQCPYVYIAGEWVKPFQQANGYCPFSRRSRGRPKSVAWRGRAGERGQATGSGMGGAYAQHTAAAAAAAATAMWGRRTRWGRRSRSCSLASWAGRHGSAPCRPRCRYCCVLRAACNAAAAAMLPVRRAY
jgi:hypothetical protein